MATLQTLPVEVLGLILQELYCHSPDSIPNFALASSTLYQAALGWQSTLANNVERLYGPLLGEALLAIQSRGRNCFDHKDEAIATIDFYESGGRIKYPGSLGELLRLLVFHDQLTFLWSDYKTNMPRPLLEVDGVRKPAIVDSLSSVEFARFFRALYRIQIFSNVFIPSESRLEDAQDGKVVFWDPVDEDYDDNVKAAYRAFFKARDHWENAEMGCVLWYMQKRICMFYDEIYNEMLYEMNQRESKKMKEENVFPTFSQDVHEVYDRFCALEISYRSDEFAHRFFNVFVDRIDSMKKYHLEGSNSADKTLDALDFTLLVYDSMSHATMLAPEVVESVSPADIVGLWRSMVELAEKYQYEGRGQFESLPGDVCPSMIKVESLEMLRCIKETNSRPTRYLAAMGPVFLHRVFHDDPFTRRQMILGHVGNLKQNAIQSGIFNPDLASFDHPEGLHGIRDIEAVWQHRAVGSRPNLAWKMQHLDIAPDETVDEKLKNVEDKTGRRWGYALWDDERVRGWTDGEEGQMWIP